VTGRLAALGKRYGKTPAQVAIAWVLEQPGVTSALTGPSTIAHLEENVGGSGWFLSASDRDDLERFLEDEETRLAAAQRQSVRDILTRPLPAGPQQAFVDLVYAVETAVLLELASEMAVLPLFQDLFRLRQTLDDDVLPQLTAIQQQLQIIIEKERQTKKTARY
jgi:hypothetical protein